MNVIFTCGGTGGHINPAIAVANCWRERYPDSKILFIGGRGNMEEQLVPKAGYDLVVMRAFGILRLLLGLLWEYAVFFAFLPIKKIVIPICRSVAGCVFRIIRLAYLRGYTKRTEKRLLDGLCGLREHGRGR